VIARSVTRGSRRRFRLTAAFGGVAALSLLAAGCASASPAADASASTAGGDFSQELHDLLPASIQKSGVISFGALWETPPVISVDEADPSKPVGISPDLAAAMAKELGVEVEWQNLQWPAQLPGLQSGTVDVLFGQVSITAEREQSVVDLIPFQSRGMSILLPADNPEKVKAVADMCGLTMGVPIGASQAAIVTKISAAACEANGKPAIKMADYQGASAAVQALRAGTVDGWLDTTTNIEDIVEANADVFDSTTVPDDEIPAEFSGIAVAKDNPGLSEALAGALKALIDDGTYGDIYKKLGLESSEVTSDEVVINPLTKTPAGEKAAS